ncbi:YwmB family TATA-box binding protein [Clostridium cellulovorans]|uniref:TATA-box binding protein n=1 Tax=Clostridium cellulovorans (strain ATCC 35296 / DSM 3052 / OCM 3 / 743B) TaxID=573061 RepID=D9STK3_CLOC7|nr:YwmB family TATA-box binding protein [Clostridium cellulovorans]ADL52737.1 hypothetical protein Clocel_3047 [Clostridium cellulovorans 743B]
MKGKMFFVSVFFIVAVYFMGQASFGQGFFIFSDYIDPKVCKYKECGVKATFEITTTFDKFLESFIEKDFIINSKSDTEIKFSNEDINGLLNVDRDRITIEVITEKKSISSRYMKELLQRKIGLKGINMKVYEYYKFKLQDENLELLKNKLIEELQRKKAKNIEAEILDGGNVYSVIADTGSFEKLTIGNKNIDINIAIAMYKSGNYIIIGTPIIPVSY